MEDIFAGAHDLLGYRANEEARTDTKSRFHLGERGREEGEVLELAGDREKTSLPIFGPFGTLFPWNLVLELHCQHYFAEHTVSCVFVFSVNIL